MLRTLPWIALSLTLDCSAPSGAVADRGGLISLDESDSQIVRAFEARSGGVQLVALLSPT